LVTSPPDRSLLAGENLKEIVVAVLNALPSLSGEGLGMRRVGDDEDVALISSEHIGYPTRTGSAFNLVAVISQRFFLLLTIHFGSGFGL
jgi:hypothetical protein